MILGVFRKCATLPKLPFLCLEEFFQSVAKDRTRRIREQRKLDRKRTEYPLTAIDPPDRIVLVLVEVIGQSSCDVSNHHGTQPIAVLSCQAAIVLQLLSEGIEFILKCAKTNWLVGEPNSDPQTSFRPKILPRTERACSIQLFPSPTRSSRLPWPVSFSNGGIEQEK